MHCSIHHMLISKLLFCKSGRHIAKNEQIHTPVAIFMCQFNTLPYGGLILRGEIFMDFSLSLKF